MVKHLEKGSSADPNLFLKKIKDLNLRNSIFVDNTASDIISKFYKNYLKKAFQLLHVIK